MRCATSCPSGALGRSPWTSCGWTGSPRGQHLQAPPCRLLQCLREVESLTRLTPWMKPNTRTGRSSRWLANWRYWPTRCVLACTCGDETAQAASHEFLARAGVLERWVQECPLHCSSPNASRPHDVPDTLMRGILADTGQRIAGSIGLSIRPPPVCDAGVTAASRFGPFTA